MPPGGPMRPPRRARVASARVAHAEVTDRDKKCGFGEKHREMVNMPEIGTMVFLGVRYSR